MYTKEWYKENYKKCKRSLSWYKTCCGSQAHSLKKIRGECDMLKAQIRELEREVSELKSVLHVANAALKLEKKK